GWSQYQSGVSSYEFGVDEYQSGKQDLAEARKKLDDAKVELDDAKTELVDAKQELVDAEVKLTDARTELDDGWQKYLDGQTELADGEATLVTETADAQVEIADGVRDLRDGEVEYNDGLTEYNDGKAEAEEKIGDAERELADARRKVADIGDAKWYLLSRDSNPGYLGYGQDADRMGNLADLFPLLFFLVAALVCLTTMTRMVEEERVQIGSLKALGYTRWTISKKYVGYALLPSLLGGLVGLAIGYTLFPKMIFTAYQIMYQVPDIQLSAYGDISSFSLLAGVGCTLLATLGACLATLASTPANLMRPRAPKPGKRVLLEYIRPLWRRMRFTHKVTARNLLRYHLRFWMTVAGIGGCTALIIAGFGLRTSLLGAMDAQYADIYHYTAQLSVSDNFLPEERSDLEQYLADNDQVTGTLPCYLSSVTAESPAYSISVYLEAASPELGNFVTLRDMKGQPLTLSDEGVIINKKLSEMLDVGIGDRFTLDGDSRAEVTVAGITEHYLGHFVYLSPAYYEKVFGSPCAQNAYLLTLADDSAAACDAVFSDTMDLPGVVSATRMLDTRDTYMRSMERIDFVVVIVILSAAALALVVLYNLSNINITERKRELATIRVLGFYDAEVSAYVNRENAVLTLFGIGFGIFCGHFLHVWLVKSVEIEMMMFVRKTDPTAYLWAALLTVAFSVLTALLAHRKMKRIDMVESLKSAE
ncbi:MAG: FtsX-like permease family protein, partial [Oscillibacter sp.]